MSSLSKPQTCSRAAQVSIPTFKVFGTITITMRAVPWRIRKPWIIVTCQNCLQHGNSFPVDWSSGVCGAPSRKNLHSIEGLIKAWHLPERTVLEIPQQVSSLLRTRFRFNLKMNNKLLSSEQLSWFVLNDYSLLCRRCSDNDQRIHKCNTLGCKVLGFIKRTDLRRHRCSHEAPRFFRAMTTCRAHTKEFKRKGNLTEHQKRFHGNSSGDSISTLVRLIMKRRVHQTYLAEKKGWKTRVQRWLRQRWRTLLMSIPLPRTSCLPNSRSHM